MAGANSGEEGFTACLGCGSDAGSRVVQPEVPDLVLLPGCAFGSEGFGYNCWSKTEATRASADVRTKRSGHGGGGKRPLLARRHCRRDHSSSPRGAAMAAAKGTGGHDAASLPKDLIRLGSGQSRLGGRRVRQWRSSGLRCSFVETDSSYCSSSAIGSDDSVEVWGVSRLLVLVDRR